MLKLPDGQAFDVLLREDDDSITALAYPRGKQGSYEGDPVAQTEGGSFDEAEKKLYGLLMKKYY